MAEDGGLSISKIIDTLLEKNLTYVAEPKYRNYITQSLRELSQKKFTVEERYNDKGDYILKKKNHLELMEEALDDISYHMAIFSYLYPDSKDIFMANTIKKEDLPNITLWDSRILTPLSVEEIKLKMSNLKLEDENLLLTKFLPRKVDRNFIIANAFFVLAMHALNNGIKVMNPDNIKIYTYIGVFLAIVNLKQDSLFSKISNDERAARNIKQFNFRAFIDLLIIRAEGLSILDNYRMMRGDYPDISIRSLFNVCPVLEVEACHSKHPLFSNQNSNKKKLNQRENKDCISLKNLLINSLINYIYGIISNEEIIKIRKRNSFGYHGLVSTLSSIRNMAKSRKHMLNTLLNYFPVTKQEHLDRINEMIFIMMHEGHWES